MLPVDTPGEMLPADMLVGDMAGENLGEMVPGSTAGFCCGCDVDVTSPGVFPQFRQNLSIAPI